MNVMKRDLHTRMVISLFLLVMTVAPMLRAASGSGAQIEFEDAEIFIEFNSTDEDVGVQVFLDGEPWRTLRIVNPNGRTILNTAGSGSLRTQGLTEFFFESSEPSLDEVPLSEFLARFPEGEYTFIGATTEGEMIEGADTFTHDIPDGPSIVLPQRNGLVLNPGKVTIGWDPVTTPAGIEIVSYEVIVSGGNPKREFRVLLPATITRVKVPQVIFEPDRRYEFEVLAKEKSGNQTITSGFFRTAP